MKNKIIQTFQFLLEVIGIVLLNMFIFLVVFFIILYIFRNDKKDEHENDSEN
jgi:uncharacterized membrane protein